MKLRARDRAVLYAVGVWSCVAGLFVSGPFDRAWVIVFHVLEAFGALGWTALLVSLWLRVRRVHRAGLTLMQVERVMSRYRGTGLVRREREIDTQLDQARERGEIDTLIEQADALSFDRGLGLIAAQPEPVAWELQKGQYYEITQADHPERGEIGQCTRRLELARGTLVAYVLVLREEDGVTEHECVVYADDVLHHHIDSALCLCPGCRAGLHGSMQ
ncbi:MAG TPA: hypothetical protein VK807_23375 [Gemmatimonadaceae bacterium]|jgi:hypothetical protein|nr:hypothetical protein [Gemmatimonadaceae bacterium]